jgi:dTDP-4-amino-4,6-dideoxygalactose transaminase
MSTVLQPTEIEHVLQLVESDLLRRTGGRAIQWYGRAATALYRAFQLARRLHGNAPNVEVILPSISCATPANAALLAGVIPRFADVHPETGMPTLQAIQERWTANTGAVVFIHLFGQTADLKRVGEWCRAKGVLLIEDLAQALGASLPDGTAAGSVGDLSVLSFNPTKILECGGGALLIRSPQLTEPLAQLAESDPLPLKFDEAQAATLALSYRNLHHSLVALMRSRSVDEISSAFLKLQPAFRSLYLRRMKNPAALLNAWAQLENVLRHRLQNAEQYDQLLAVTDWRRLRQWRQSGVCWRYSLLIDFPDQLVSFSEAVRRDGFHVSNLYWPLNDFFLPADVCPNAESFARRIVNLWVDSSVDIQWVSNCAKNLLKNRPRQTI